MQYGMWVCCLRYLGCLRPKRHEDGHDVFRPLVLLELKQGLVLQTQARCFVLLKRLVLEGLVEQFLLSVVIVLGPSQVFVHDDFAVRLLVAFLALLKDKTIGEDGARFVFDLVCVGSRRKDRLEDGSPPIAKDATGPQDGQELANEAQYQKVLVVQAEGGRLARHEGRLGVLQDRLVAYVVEIGRETVRGCHLGGRGWAGAGLAAVEKGVNDVERVLSIRIRRGVAYRLGDRPLDVA